MFISPDELYTHLYTETREAISGETDPANDRNLAFALDVAISEVKGYLSRYDLDAIFSATGDARNAMLLLICKDVAVWHYINAANPNCDFQVRRTRYEDAIAWLKGVQSGDIQPDLPLPKDPDTGDEENTTGFLIGSNPKRMNHI
jgi:phage gp36-like protein